MYLHKIPILYCPFDSAIHPMIDQIEEHTNQWVLDFQLIQSYESLEHYRKQRFAAWVARSYPYGTYQDLCAWCDLITLLFVFDDQIDEGGTIKDEESLLSLERRFLEVLEQNKKCEIGPDGPILAALSDFWQRMLLRSKKTWQRRMIRGIKDMFAGGMWQFRHIVGNKRPEFNEYMVMRQFLGAANLATDSLEVTGQIELQEEVYQNPAIERLTEICRNTICFANDLFSLSKEIANSNGADFNLVTIVKNKFQLTIEQAIKRTATIHDGLVEEFIDISKKAFVYNDTVNAMLAKYLHALRYLMKGNIDWSTMDTTRYPHIYGN